METLTLRLFDEDRDIITVEQVAVDALGGDVGGVLGDNPIWFDWSLGADGEVTDPEGTTYSYQDVTLTAGDEHPSALLEVQIRCTDGQVTTTQTYSWDLTEILASEVVNDSDVDGDDVAAALESLSLAEGGVSDQEVTVSGGTEGTLAEELQYLRDQIEALQAAQDTTPPGINGVSASQDQSEVTVEVNTGERLGAESDDLSVQVTLPSGATDMLDRLDFSEDLSGGLIIYSAVYTPTESGTHTFLLQSAKDAAGNEGAQGEDASLDVDLTPPTVSNFSVTSPSAGTVRVEFDVDESAFDTTVTLDQDGASYQSISGLGLNGGSPGTVYVERSVPSGHEYTGQLYRCADAQGNNYTDAEGVTLLEGSVTI